METYKCSTCPMRAKHDAVPTSFLGKFWRWHIFPARGWALLIFMMGLGIALKHIPGVSSAFTASFYSGLGPMLLVSSTRFLLYMKS